MFWNSNGLRDQTKPRFLFESVKEHQLDFIAISESKRSDFNQIELAHCCANKDFKWSWTQPKGLEQEEF
jgi:exonuclease III